jgi:hypothetical protein
MGALWSPGPDATEVTMGNFGTRTAAAFLVASLLVLVPATTAAATKTYRFTISGTEVSATSTTGRFVGAASGSALGTWYAEVIHDPLGTSANIRSGGSFGMALHQAEPAYLVSGQFSGGTITVNNPGRNCTNQVYTVKVVSRYRCK